MAKQTEKTEEAKGVPADLLKRASAVPAGVKTQEYNPMEAVPTLTVGKDFSAGMTIAGYFDENEVIASHKFKYSKTMNEEGVPTSTRHVIRVGSPTGEKLAIWSCGELRLAFEKINRGDFISIKYLKKGLNSKGEDQHFFELGLAPTGAPSVQ